MHLVCERLKESLGYARLRKECLDVRSDPAPSPYLSSIGSVKIDHRAGALREPGGVAAVVDVSMGQQNAPDALDPEAGGGDPRLQGALGLLGLGTSVD